MKPPAINLELPTSLGPSFVLVSTSGSLLITFLSVTSIRASSILLDWWIGISSQ